MDGDWGLGRLAIEAGLISQGQLADCLKSQGDRPLRDVLREKGFLTESQIDALLRARRPTAGADSGFARASTTRRADHLLVQRALERKRITADQLREGLAEQEESAGRGNDRPLGQIFVGKGWLQVEDLVSLLGEPETPAEAAPDLPRYPVCERLGEGATAIVYRAWDRELKRFVALKVLRHRAGLSEVARQRFRREAETAAGLTHPNVVAVYDVGEAPDLLYLVMELVEGRPLSDVLKERPADDRTVVRLLEKAARGVAQAHAKGVVHRDLKPANILVTPDGEPKVGDFGLAHLVDAKAELTRTGTALGTPLYMAREQVQANPKDISPATDVYALGVIGYEAVTGRPPFVGDTVLEIYEHIIRDEPVAPRKVTPRVPADLEAILLKALEKDPQNRYPTAAELADDLARFLSGEPVAAKRRGPLDRLGRAVRKHAAGASAATLACAVAIAAVVAYRRTPAPVPPARPVSEKAAHFERVGRSVFRVDAGGKMPASAGLEVRSGDWVETAGPDADAVVSFADATRLRLGGDSRVRILFGAGEGKTVFVARGRVAAEVLPVSGGPTLFTTPEAEVRVPGGRLHLLVEPGETRIEVWEGSARLVRARDRASLEVPGGRFAVASESAELAARPMFRVPTEGLELWLRADEGVTCEGGRVTRWADASGRERHAVSAGPASRPALEAAALNGNPVVRFDGRDDALKVAGEFGEFPEGLTLVAATRPAGARAQVWAAVQDPDGGVTRHGASAETTARVRNSLGLGDASERPRLEGDVAELLLYRRMLPEAERLAVEDYLDDKYLNPSPPPAGTVRGLKGEYFNDVHFKDLALTRVDAAVDFDWGQQAPDPRVRRDIFAVRWTGELQPRYSETYTITALIDDGARVWVDGRLIIDDWKTHPAEEREGTIPLVAGRRTPIRVEYQDGALDAVMKLYWSSPSQPREIIPRRRLFAAK